MEKDEREAVRWFRRAAEAGHAGGMRNLGLCLEFGSGTAIDKRAALAWYRKAATAGHAKAPADIRRVMRKL